MKKTAILFFSMLAAAPWTIAQATFNLRHDLGHPACFLSGVIATDSGYCAIGSGVAPSSGSLGSLFVKFDQYGDPVLIKDHTVPDALLSTAEPAFARDSDGNFFVGGTLQDSIRKVYLIKYDGNGDTIFTRKYVHPLFPVESFVYTHDLELTAGGGVAMTGNLTMPDGTFNTDLFVLRTDGTGEPVFFKPYGTVQYDDFGINLLVSQNGFIIGGIRDNTNTNDEDYTFQALFLHIDGDGGVISEHLTPDSYLSDWAHDMVLLEDGSLVVATGIGTEIDNVSVNTVWFEKSVLKLNPDGEVEWQVSFPEIEITGSAHTSKIVKMSDDSGFVVAGTEAEDLPGDDTFVVRGWLAKVKDDGTKTWERRYTIVETDLSEHSIIDMKETSDGGLILCGEAQDVTGQDSIPQQAWLLKLDAHGCLVPGCHLTDATGEGERPEMELAIYPNPAVDYLNFQLRGAGIVKGGSFRVTDAQGRIVRELPTGGNVADTFILPVWGWGAGVYFLQYLEGGEVLATERFIIAK